MSPDEVYALLVKECQQHDLPKGPGRWTVSKCDKRDLHDLRPRRFLWLLRDAGTWLLMPNSTCEIQILATHIKLQLVSHTYWYEDGQLTPSNYHAGWKLLMQHSGLKVQKFATELLQDAALGSFRALIGKR